MKTKKKENDQWQMPTKEQWDILDIALQFDLTPDKLKNILAEYAMIRVFGNAFYDNSIKWQNKDL